MTRSAAIHLVLWLAFLGAPALSQMETRDGPYDVVWRTPSRDASGSMPLGNGDIGLNAWVEPSGDLLFYISKTDAWGDNARLLKVGRVRIRLDPAPVTSDPSFRQVLRLADATMVVRCGRGDRAVELKVWVDANLPVVHVTVEGRTPRQGRVIIEPWRTRPHALPSLEVSDVLLDRSKPDQKHGTTIVEPDTMLADATDRIGWFHHNVKSVGPALCAEIQGLRGFRQADPLLRRTFGAAITAVGGRRVDGHNLTVSASRVHRFDIYVLTRHPAAPEQWRAAMDEVVTATEGRPFAERRRAHERWWQAFWDRSWIHATVRASAAPPNLLPVNDHPVRVGIDQNGGNRFTGKIARVSLLSRPMSDAEVRALAATDRGTSLQAGTGLLVSQLGGGRVAAPGSTDWSFDTGLTLEAWVRPSQESGGGGRLVDKITPGGADGFLLDTWPGHGVRLIFGDTTLTRSGGLPVGKWTHVAAVVDPAAGQAALYLDGEAAVRRAVEARDDAYVVSRAYALQRFINACAGRGAFPIKFNGSIFTVPWPGKPGDADYRRWGPGYWWQNTRLPYIGMCTSGDLDLMQPLFRMYVDEVLPLSIHRTRRYCGHGGAFIPECIYFWGAMFSETYGWTPFEQRGEDKLQSSRWHKWEWVSGLELVHLMLDYYDHTQDGAFLAEKVLPTAHQILTFFDEHYDVGADGRLAMHPSQAVETWWECTNPMPEVAGLRAVTSRLLALSKELADDRQRAFWAGLRTKLPDLPTREVEGARALAPAQKYAMKRNIENPELYAVYPFRLVGVGRPDLGLGLHALKHRWDRGNSGWRQDDLFMACLGLAEDARRNLVDRARNKHTQSRFPAFWGPNYDWIPDQDHGGILVKTLQAMVLQADPGTGGRIHLLPAWPPDWDVRFKLHAPERTTVDCEYRAGRLTRLDIVPPHRRRDVILPAGIKPPSRGR